MSNHDLDSIFSSSKMWLIAGPCAVESKELLEEVAEVLVTLRDSLPLNIILKGSYRKANRTKLTSFTGIGDEKALSFLRDVGKAYKLPTITDIHAAPEAAMAAEYVDILQIPAFLCRQTDLLLAAGNTGKIINIKKGQFLSGTSMSYAVEKVKSTGNNKILLTERGNTFGYQDLVVDYRNIVEMSKCDVPVIMDCTHALQKPNNASGVTGGDPEKIETIARAALAVGADGLFIETHPDPSIALSDGANMLSLKNLPKLIAKLSTLFAAVKELD